MLEFSLGFAGSFLGVFAATYTKRLFKKDPTPRVIRSQEYKTQWSEPKPKARVVRKDENGNLIGKQE